MDLCESLVWIRLCDDLRQVQEEEVYYFRSDPRSLGAVVLMTVDETSYVGESLYTSGRRN